MPPKPAPKVTPPIKAPKLSIPFSGAPEIAVMAAANGWMVFATTIRSPTVTLAGIGPVMVAETPERLAEIVTAWAEGRR